MDDFLYTLGIIQSSVVADALEDIYFYDWQIGSQEDMTPGLVDVSVILFVIYLCFNKIMYII